VLAGRPAGDPRQGPGSAVDESPGVGRIAEQSRDRRGRRPPPDDGTLVAAPLAARSEQPGGHHLPDHAADRSSPQERGEDEGDSLTNVLVRVLDHAPGQVAHQADRQAHGQLTAAGLVDRAGMKPRLDRVKSQFRDQALQSQDQPAVGRGRVVDRLLIPDEATAVTAQIKELIPIGAVACQARDIIGEDDADLPAIDARDEFLNPGRPAELLPVTPRSASRIWTLEASHPKARARSVRAYWSLRLS
jgi:hypothetical protein